MSIVKEFKQFVLHGNAIDLAVGVVIGASFGNVVTALVKDIVTPLIGSIGRVPSFNNLSFVINNSRFMYGDFLNVLISFIIVAAVIFFFVVKPMNMLMSRMNKSATTPDPTTKKCIECLSEIPMEAKRCAHCAVVVK